MASQKTMGFKELAIASSLVANVALGGALLYVKGQVKVQDAINFVPNGTTTGSLLQLNGVTQFQAFTKAGTGTGGNVKVSGGAKYDTFITASPLTTTGAIKEISLMISASPVVVGLECGFVKSRNGGTGSSIHANLDNVQTATGKIIRFSTGSVRWNPADFLKCGTLGTPTSSFAGKLRVELYDDESE